MPHRWNKAAAIRKEQIETGKDITFNKVFVPYYETIIKKLAPQSLLEIGCGTGHLSLALSKYVKTLHAIDPAIDMHKTAQLTLKDSQALVFNCRMNEYLTKEKYDLIISHLCLHSIGNIDEFFNAVKKHLQHNASFFFSIPHPCFWHHYHPEWFGDFDYMREQHLEVNLTITNERDNPITGVPYIHRPLSSYFTALKANKLTILGFDEIFPADDIQKLYEKNWEEPRYCVFHVGVQ